jgi:Tol biopolymer transport system component
MTMDPDGSHQTVIANGDPDWIRWSPDGSMLVLQKRAHQSGDIFVMNADGSHLTNLTTSKAYDWSPSWSPDSTKIVWSRSASAADPGDLFVMDADGSNRTRLTSTAHLDEYEPDWTA